MLNEFIDFVDSILPSVSPDTRDRAKDAILQFEKTGEQLKYMMYKPLKQLSQGDILSKIPFIYFEEDGLQKTLKFIDFEYMNTYNKDLIVKGIDLGRVKRIGSLNQLGYYFFIVKLTVYLMRKEDSDTLSKRNLGFAY